MGETYVFEVGASNVGTYQWQKNEVNISGANGSSYLIPTLAAADAGLYRVIITGAGACASETITSANAALVINIPVTILVQPQPQTVCEGASVTFTVAASGTLTGYQWYRNGTPIAGATTTTYGLTTTSLNNNDRYRVEVLGVCSNLMSTEVTLTVISPNTPTITTNKPNGMCEGESSILTATGCKPTDTVLWYSDGLSIATGATLTTTSTATFTARCQEGSCVGLQSSNTITPVQLPPISYTVVKQNISCFEGQDGLLSITPSGAGGAPYTIAWQNQSSQAFQLTGLAAATYTFTITDRAGCQKTFSETLTQPAKPSGTVATEDITCFGAANGRMTINAQSDNGGLQFILNNAPAVAFGGSHLSNTLTKGTYTVRVVDARNCEVIPATTFTIQEPNELILTTARIQRPRGATTQDGAVAVALSGGTLPYSSVSWTTSQGVAVPSTSTNDTTKIGSVGGGTYQLRVIDKNGCEKTLAVTLVAPAPITITANVDSISCFGRTDGRIVVSIAGGVRISTALPYSTLWERIAANGSRQEVARNTTTISNLAPGRYEVTVADSNAITSVRAFTLNEPALLQSAVVSMVPNYCASTPLGGATLRVEGGRSPYDIRWDRSTEVGSVAAALPSGNNVATITDASGCVVTASATVPDSTSTFRLAVAYVQPSCFGRCDGRLTGTVQGGSSPYRYSWTNLSDTTTLITTVCGSGSTVFEVRDAKGCFLRSAPVSLSSPAPRVLDLSKEKEVCPSEPFELSAASLTWGKAFTWISPKGVTKTGSVIQGDTLGVYKLSVFDENGCGGQEEILVIPNKSVQQLFTVASEATVNRTVVCVDLTNPVPSSIRWEYPGATLVRQNAFELRIRYAQTGTYQIKELATVNNCVYTLIKEIEIKDAIDNRGFPEPIGFNPLDVKVLGNPVNGNRIGLDILNEANEDFTITLQTLSGNQTLYQQEFVNQGSTQVQMELPSRIQEGTYILNVITATTQFSARIFIAR